MLTTERVVLADSRWRSYLRELSKRSVLSFPGIHGGESTVYDFSSSLNNGAITGATWTRFHSGLWCLSFDGASYVTLPTNNTLNFTSGDFSIVAAIYTTDLTTYNTIFMRGRNTYDGYWFVVLNTGNIALATSQASASQTSYSANGSIVVNKWYIVGCSRVGASCRVYINGVDSTNTVGTHIDPLTNARVPVIGANYDLGSYPMIGRIGSVLISGQALSPAEQLRIANELLPIYYQTGHLFGV